MRQLMTIAICLFWASSLSAQVGKLISTTKLINTKIINTAKQAAMIGEKSVSIVPAIVVKNQNLGINLLRENNLVISGVRFKDNPQIGLTSRKILLSLDIPKLATELELKYKGLGFNGYYVSDLKTVETIAGATWSDKESAAAALKKAVNRSLLVEGDDGYFVVAVEGNEYRAKDILVLDAENHRWISVNKSKGYVIAKFHSELLEEALAQEKIAEQSIHKQGIIADNIGADDEVITMFTDDRVVWRHPNSVIGEDAWNAWIGNYYVKYYPHEHKLRYAESDGKPLFESLEEVDLAQIANMRGLEVEVVNYHPIVKFGNFGMSNVLLQNEQGILTPLAGNSVTGDLYSHEDVLLIVEDLRKLANNYAKTTPHGRIIYKRPVTEGKYQSGTIEKYVDYMN